MNNEDLVELIKGYIERAKTDEKVAIYPLVEIGIYRVIGGEGPLKRDIIKNSLITCRFVDAIAYAIQQPEFCGWYCDLKHTNNPNHGYVIKVEIEKPTQIPEVSPEILEDILNKYA